MSMGLVNDEDFECELNKGSQSNSNWNRAIAEIRESPTKGRAPGDVEVPESLRKIIGETSELDGRKEAVALAKMFDISESSVSAYAHGSTSTASYNKPDIGIDSIQSHINKSKERISNKARSRLFQSLKHITDEKLKEASVRDVSQVARHMSAIIKEQEPSVNTSNENNGIQFIFYSPHIKNEDVFDTITVPE